MALVPDLKRIAGYAEEERSRVVVAPNYHFTMAYKLLYHAILHFYPATLLLRYYSITSFDYYYYFLLTLLFL